GELADLLLATRRVPPALHELQVVDDDEPEVLRLRPVPSLPADLRFEPPDLRAQIEQTERRRVVEPDRQTADSRRGVGQPVPVLGLDGAAAQARDVHTRLHGEQAGGELLARHFEREEADAPTRLLDVA